MPHMVFLCYVWSKQSWTEGRAFRIASVPLLGTTEDDGEEGAQGLRPVWEETESPMRKEVTGLV